MAKNQYGVNRAVSDASDRVIPSVSFELEPPIRITSQGPQGGPVVYGGAYPTDRDTAYAKLGELESHLYGSVYSDASIASTFNPDNVSIDRHPVMSGFLVSFIVRTKSSIIHLILMVFINLNGRSVTFGYDESYLLESKIYNVNNICNKYCSSLLINNE